jgi:hypothetical protein
LLYNWSAEYFFTSFEAGSFWLLQPAATSPIKGMSIRSPFFMHLKFLRTQVKGNLYITVNEILQKEFVMR